IEELRLDDAAFEAVRGPAALRFLAIRDAERRRFDPGEEAQRAVKERLRTRLGLYRRVGLGRWGGENNLEGAAFDRLVDDEARIDAARARALQQPAERVLDQLRVNGGYAALAQRARHKAEVLGRNGHADPVPQDTGLSPLQLLAWYFEARLA